MERETMNSSRIEIKTINDFLIEQELIPKECLEDIKEYIQSFLNEVQKE